MQEIFAGVSWIGVIAGTVISFLVGWVWYSERLFGAKWATGVGVDMAKADKMPMAAMVTMLAGLFLMSWFVGVTAANNALLTVILGTVAFTVLGYAGGAFRNNSTYARNVDAGYWIASLVVMVICQGIF